MKVEECCRVEPLVPRSMSTWRRSDVGDDLARADQVVPRELTVSVEDELMSADSL